MSFSPQKTPPPAYLTPAEMSDAPMSMTDTPVTTVGNMRLRIRAGMSACVVDVPAFVRPFPAAAAAELRDPSTLPVVVEGPEDETAQARFLREHVTAAMSAAMSSGALTPAAAANARAMTPEDIARAHERMRAMGFDMPPVANILAQQERLRRAEGGP
mmetsp:Transcript_27006/g.83192  ORF Transcript_27006/g.83192 Transcript_27006/m.83192 type:complete len:158 (-) Transcript_27006:25-498(-)